MLSRTSAAAGRVAAGSAALATVMLVILAATISALGVIFIWFPHENE
jgi:hypothetical protein